MMDLFTAISHLRERVGSPDTDDVSQRKLRGYLESALESVAAELHMPVVVRAALWTFTADEYRYPLPQDCGQILWVEWNGTKLEPASIGAWVRDKTNWRTASSSNPVSWAVEGRSIIFYPPPSSTAITTDPAADVSYIGVPEVGDGGVAQFTDAELWCAIYQAAAEYLGIHPSEENMARKQACEQEFERRLPRARQRRNNMAVQQHAQIRVWSARLGR